MFCRECGAGISADSRFCKECGAKVSISARMASIPVEDLEPISDEVSQERLRKLLEMAFWHYDAGNPSAAIKACEAALLINPSSTTAHSLMATIYEKQGDDKHAIQHLEEVLVLNPDSTADQEKLAHLKFGVDAKLVPPPVGYRWIPPALAGISKSGNSATFPRLSELRVGPVQLIPILCSVLAMAIVLVIGLSMLHANNKLSVADRTVPSTVVFTPEQPYQGDTSAAPPPVVQSPPIIPARSLPESLKPIDLNTTPEVFGGAAAGAQSGGEASNVQVPAAPSLPNSARRSLPPLTAIPDGSIPPAPVDVSSPLVSPTDIPNHTVVVTQLGGSQGDDGQGTAPATASNPPMVTVAAPDTSDAATSGTQSGSNDGGSAPVINITVHDAPPVDQSASDSGLNQGTGPVPVVTAHDDEAKAYQQYALSMQQQGDYHGAVSAYQRAIRSYNEQIRSGHNSDDVTRGLQACKTGLEICQQSLQQ